MAVEKLFWENMKEYGGLDCVDITFHERDFQIVSDSSTDSYLLYEINRPGQADMILKEFPSLESMLDESDIDGFTIREILQKIDIDDYFWH